MIAALKAMGHAMRRDIVETLYRNDGVPMSPSEISRQCGLPLPRVGYHVRQLARFKAVKLVKTEPVRGSLKHFYRLSQSFIERPSVFEFLE
jgi:DNA-binding transcriptional regulator GbsR (MarR family)